MTNWMYSTKVWSEMVRHTVFLQLSLPNLSLKTSRVSCLRWTVRRRIRQHPKHRLSTKRHTTTAAMTNREAPHYHHSHKVFRARQVKKKNACILLLGEQTIASASSQLRVMYINCSIQLHVVGFFLSPILRLLLVGVCLFWVFVTRILLLLGVCL